MRLNSRASSIVAGGIAAGFPVGLSVLANRGTYRDRSQNPVVDVLGQGIGLFGAAYAGVLGYQSHRRSQVGRALGAISLMGASLMLLTGSNFARR
jgi:hypothetical protein